MIDFVASRSGVCAYFVLISAWAKNFAAIDIFVSRLEDCAYF